MFSHRESNKFRRRSKNLLEVFQPPQKNSMNKFESLPKFVTLFVTPYCLGGETKEEY
jgi:hypothetical protein